MRHRLIEVFDVSFGSEGGRKKEVKISLDPIFPSASFVFFACTVQLLNWESFLFLAPGDPSLIGVQWPMDSVISPRLQAILCRRHLPIWL
jgi:hypothetical protein